MNKKTYIPRRDKEDNLYKRLQDRSLKMIGELSGNRWTDFNEHDPGITLLDLLNYALLELDYALDAPFEEYLTDSRKNELIYEKFGLLPPGEIFEPVIVSAEDYESLIRTVKGVKNCRVTVENALYIILIEPTPDADKNSLRTAVFKCYHRYRNLCENLGEIRFGKATSSRNPLKKDNFPEYTPTPEKAAFSKKEFIYHTIQNELPECYGIGERGLPGSSPLHRKMEALQLKAYLLVFDYLMSGVSLQMKGIKQLLELSGNLPDPFSPRIEIPDIEKLLDKEKLQQSEVFNEQEKTRQKSLFFDWLDLLYGEDTGKYSGTQSLSFRANLIRRFPEFNTFRFRSFDLTDTEMKTMPGIKLLINGLLENDLRQEIPVTNSFSRYNLKLITDQKFFGQWQGLFNVEFLMGENPEPENQYDLSDIPSIPTEPDLRKFYRLRNRLNIFRHNILFEGFLKSGMHPENYRCLQLQDQSGYLLLYKQPDHREWINLGFFFEKQKLIETCNLLWIFMEKLNRESLSFYFIEHILLWEDIYWIPKEYNRLSVIIPKWVDHLYSREMYLELFEERLPAHLDIRCIWLGVEEIKSFETFYFQWRKAWAFHKEEKIVEFSKSIKDLINHHQS